MTEPAHSFEDGAAYERFMGRWSRAAGAAFLDWLAPPPGLHWLDAIAAIAGENDRERH